MSQHLLKHLCYLIVATLLFGSCKKESNTSIPIDEEEYEVRWRVSSFTQEVQPMGNLMSKKSEIEYDEDGNNPALKHLNRLDYFVYNTDGDLVRNSTQLNVFAPYSDPFGRVAFTLPIGDYKMIVIGSSLVNIAFPDSARYATASLQPSDQPNQDIFYKEIPFQVKANEINTNTIVIERIVGSLEVRLIETPNEDWTENPWVKVKTVVKYPFDENGDYEIEEYYPFRHSTGTRIPGVTSEFVSGGMILPDRSGNFDCEPKITIAGQRLQLIRSQLVEGVIIKPNTKVVLKNNGTITEERGRDEFAVTADSTWGAQEIIQFENN